MKQVKEMLCVEIVRGYMQAVQLANKYRQKGYEIDVKRDEYDGKFCIFANVDKVEWYVAKNVNDYSNKI